MTNPGRGVHPETLTSVNRRATLKDYRAASLIRNRPLEGPYSRTMSRAL